MSEQDIRRLVGYDVGSVTRTDTGDCYDVVLTPRPLPEVRLRIRKEDLARLAEIVVRNEDGLWRLNLDCGSLYEEEWGLGYSSGIDHLVGAEIGDGCSHFYGYHKEDE